jgi:bacteriocin-like protein
MKKHTLEAECVDKTLSKEEMKNISGGNTDYTLVYFSTSGDPFSKPGYPSNPPPHGGNVYDDPFQ